MPAPKRPNTAAATEAVRQRGQQTIAAKLRQAGWLVMPPETVATVIAKDDVTAAFLRGYMGGE